MRVRVRDAVAVSAAAERSGSGEDVRSGAAGGFNTDVWMADGSGAAQRMRGIIERRTGGSSRTLRATHLADFGDALLDLREARAPRG